jgi:hypothetical protein
MSTAALNVCSVREGTVPILAPTLRAPTGRPLAGQRWSACSAKMGLPLFNSVTSGDAPPRTVEKDAICSPTISSSVTSGNPPFPRTRKNRHFDPKNLDHIGRTTATSHYQSTASAIRRSRFAARQKHAKHAHLALPQSYKPWRIHRLKAPNPAFNLQFAICIFQFAICPETPNPALCSTYNLQPTTYPIMNPEPRIQFAICNLHLSICNPPRPPTPDP